MAKLTIWFGLALVVLGVVGYVGSGADSLTALIPSVVGAILAGLGLAAREPARHGLALKLAIAIAVLAILGSAMGLADLPDLIAGEDVDRPWAVAVQSIMTVAMLAYLALAIRWLLRGRDPGSGGDPATT